MGESCDWSHRNAGSRAPGNGLAQLGYEVNAGRAGRANNRNLGRLPPRPQGKPGRIFRRAKFVDTRIIVLYDNR